MYLGDRGSPLVIQERGEVSGIRCPCSLELLASLPFENLQSLYVCGSKEANTLVRYLAFWVKGSPSVYRTTEHCGHGAVGCLHEPEDDLSNLLAPWIPPRAQGRGPGILVEVLIHNNTNITFSNKLWAPNIHTGKRTNNVSRSTDLILSIQVSTHLSLLNHPWSVRSKGKWGEVRVI